MLQYALIALLATNLLTGAISYHYGGKHTADAIRAVQLEQVAKSIDTANAQVAEDQVLATEAVQAKEIIKTVYVKIKGDADANINQNPNYDECGLDADGLRLYNAQSADQPDDARGIND